MVGTGEDRSPWEEPGLQMCPFSSLICGTWEQEGVLNIRGAPRSVEDVMSEKSKAAWVNHMIM